MKKMLLLLVICCLHSVSAQPPDSCLKMIWPNDYSHHNGTSHGSVNPDSVRVDSCEWSPTYGRMFAQRYFYIGLPENYYPFEPMPDWDDILTVNDISNNYADFKQTFQQLESELGTIYFRKGDPGMTQFSDSIILQNPWIIVFFEDYQDIDYVEELFENSIDSADYVLYLNQARIPTDIVEENNPEKSNFIISPNPVEDRLTIKAPDDIKNQKIIIYNSPGIEVLRIPYQEQIDVSGLPSGVYYLRIGENVTKFIKI